MANDLIKFCETQKYRPENGHSVVMFGEEYSYSRNKQPERPAPIPTELNSLIEKITTDFPENEVITQVLINQYEGQDSFLPFHSDDEKMISPNSSIYTFSLGNPCTLTFKHLISGEEKPLNANNNSLYVMSRTSQRFWCHGIEKSTELNGTRYSITMRTVANRYMKSSVIVGDSNTKFLRFGKGKETFGYNMPGEAIYAPTLDMIEPSKCIGYNNVFLHCGINDVRQPGSDVQDCAERLIEAVERIKIFCPRTRIFIHPLLPTKSHNLNGKALEFNDILFRYVDNRNDPYIQSLNFNIFLDTNSGLLRGDMGRYHSTDQLHLGAAGYRMLAMLIRDKVLGSRTDGRPFSNITDSSSGGSRGVRRTPVGNGHRSSFTDNGDAPPMNHMNGGDFPPLS